MKLELGIITEEKAWKSLPNVNKKSISRVIKEVLNYFPHLQHSTIEVAALLTNDAKMRKLNFEFLGKDRPTNILSFPDCELNKNDLLEFAPNKEYIYIGDVALGYEIIKLEALERAIDIYEHVAHLLVHGVLHLLGYDHQVEEDAEEMMRLEIEFLKKFNIKSPY